MSAQPQTNDVIRAYVTYARNDTRMSVARNHRVTFTTGASRPTWENLTIAAVQVHHVRFEPILAPGDYEISYHARVYRDGELLETVQLDDIPTSIPGAGGYLPPTTCPLSSFRASPPLSRQVSRLYWPFAKAEYLGADAKLTQAGRDAVHAQALTWIGTLDWGGSGWALRTRLLILTRTGLTGPFVALAETKNLIATQRRRGRGTQETEW